MPLENCITKREGEREREIVSKPSTVVQYFIRGTIKVINFSRKRSILYFLQFSFKVKSNRVVVFMFHNGHYVSRSAVSSWRESGVSIPVRKLNCERWNCFPVPFHRHSDKGNFAFRENNVTVDLDSTRPTIYSPVWPNLRTESSSVSARHQASLIRRTFKEHRFTRYRSASSNELAVKISRRTNATRGCSLRKRKNSREELLIVPKYDKTKEKIRTSSFIFRSRRFCLRWSN